jgi:hypothetical protein
MLQHHGVVEQETPIAQSAVEHLAGDYSLYLHQERCLAGTTVKKYVRAAQTPLGRLEEPEDVARRSSLPLFRCGPFHDGSRHKRNWRGLYYVTA